MKSPETLVVAIATILVAGPALRPDVRSAHAQGVVQTSVGGGGEGEVAVPRGVWTFDLLSPDQRSANSNCLNAVLNPPGEILYPYEWLPSKKGFVPPRVEMLDPMEFPATKEELAEIGGGVLRFDEPDFGFLPWHFNFIESPAWPAEHLADSTLFPEITLWALNSGVTHDGFYLTAGVRVIDSIDGPQFWSTLDQPILEGSHPYRFSFYYPLEFDDDDDIQVMVGVRNLSDQPVEGRGPAVDKIQLQMKKNEAREWKYVPDIKQKGPTCIASAFANCLSWWAKNGYPELVSGDTDKEKNEKLRQDLEDEIFEPGRDGEVGTEDDGEHIGDIGVVRFLIKKGVYVGQPRTVEDRKQLEIVRWENEEATWDQLKEDFENGGDVLLRVQWYKANGELAHEDASHYLTVSRVDDDSDDDEEDDEKKIRVANPWGVSHHTVTETNKDRAYETVDVTVSESGRIRLDNDKLEKRAVGIDDADYLCVTDITVVRKDSSGNLALDDTTSIEMTQSDPEEGVARYEYSVRNGELGPMDFFVLTVDVPLLAVQAPVGWSYAPTPAAYPGGGGCGNVIGASGIAFSTGSAPIGAGDTLGGFEIDVASALPVEDTGLQAYLNAGNAGQFLLAAGPVGLLGDLNDDGVVGGIDLAIVLGAWATINEDVDLNGDLFIDGIDLAIVLGGWSI